MGQGAEALVMVEECNTPEEGRHGPSVMDSQSQVLFPLSPSPSLCYPSPNHILSAVPDPLFPHMNHGSRPFLMTHQQLLIPIICCSSSPDLRGTLEIQRRGVVVNQEVDCLVGCWKGVATTVKARRCGGQHGQWDVD
jgi:hypothetical protein